MSKKLICSKVNECKNRTNGFFCNHSVPHEHDYSCDITDAKCIPIIEEKNDWIHINCENFDDFPNDILNNKKYEYRLYYFPGEYIYENIIRIKLENEKDENMISGHSEFTSTKGVIYSFCDYRLRKQEIKNDNENKIKPCPFCGGEASIGTNTYNKNSDFAKENGGRTEFYFVNCENCGATSGEMLGAKDTKQQAVEKWNKRAIIPDVTIIPTYGKINEPFIEEHRPIEQIKLKNEMSEAEKEFRRALEWENEDDIDEEFIKPPLENNSCAYSDKKQLTHEEVFGKWFAIRGIISRIGYLKVINYSPHSKMYELNNGTACALKTLEELNQMEYFDVPPKD